MEIKKYFDTKLKTIICGDIYKELLDIRKSLKIKEELLDYELKQLYKNNYNLELDYEPIIIKIKKHEENKFLYMQINSDLEKDKENLIEELNNKRKKEIKYFNKLKQNIKNRIYIELKKRNLDHTSFFIIEDILGCSTEELKKYLEKHFRDGMSWENYGDWHLDHITPLKEAKTKKEIFNLNHYTNLQPLWAKENLKKNAYL